jgi:hypothetical protein
METKKYIIFSLLINGLLPWALYQILSGYMESITALTIATLVPLADNLIHFCRHKKLDALGGLMLFTFLLTLMLIACGGSEKMLLIRESFITASVGLLFLVSLLLPQPLMYYLALKFLNNETLAENSKYAYFRFVMRLMSSVWGVILIAEAVVRTLLVFQLSTAEFLAVSNIVLYGFIGTAIVWTVWYRRKSAKQLQLIKLREG